MDYTEHMESRRQEELHAAYAALRCAKVDISIGELVRASKMAAGRYSDISLLAAINDTFNALNQLRRDDASSSDQ